MTEVLFKEEIGRASFWLASSGGHRGVAAIVGFGYRLCRISRRQRSGGEVDHARSLSARLGYPTSFPFSVDRRWLGSVGSDRHGLCSDYGQPDVTVFQTSARTQLPCFPGRPSPSSAHAGSLVPPGKLSDLTQTSR
jgi:hypothetical protein